MHINYFSDLIFEVSTVPVGLQLVGIIFDILGAYLIARSFIVKDVKRIASESFGSAYKDLAGGDSNNLARSFYVQTVEARMGIVVITLGFALQATGVIFPVSYIHFLFALIAIVTVAMATVIVFKSLTSVSRVEKIIDTADRELS